MPMISVHELKLNESNPRTITGARFEDLKRSITSFERMMSLRPIVVDEHNVVLGGNMRLRAVAALGYTEIPDEWVIRATDLTNDQKREFIIKDNTDHGEWNFDALANDWDDLPLVEWGVEVPNLNDIPNPYNNNEKEARTMECPNCGHQW